MKKKYIVKSNKEFNDVIKCGKRFRDGLFCIYYKKNIYDYNRYGIAVSSKLGNAVFRNKIKRQVRSIINSFNIVDTGYDIIIMARFNVKKALFLDINRSIDSLLNKIGDNSEKK